MQGSYWYQNIKDTNISTDAAINIIETFCVQPVLGRDFNPVGLIVSLGMMVYVASGDAVGVFVSNPDEVA